MKGLKEELAKYKEIAESKVYPQRLRSSGDDDDEEEVRPRDCFSFAGRTIVRIKSFSAYFPRTVRFTVDSFHFSRMLALLSSTPAKHSAAERFGRGEDQESRGCGCRGAGENVKSFAATVLVPICLQSPDQDAAIAGGGTPCEIGEIAGGAEGNATSSCC